MKFAQLPSESIAAVTARCDHQIAVNLSKTCKQMSKIVKAYQLDKIDVHIIEFSFLPVEHKLKVWIWARQNIEINWKQTGRFMFERSFELSELSDYQESDYHIAYEKIRKILSAIKSITGISFNVFTIDTNFIQIFKKTLIKWKNVSAEFNVTSYNIPKEEVVTLWESFKTVRDINAKFQEPVEEVMTDEMMLRTLPNITINNYRMGPKNYTGLTDKTLEILAQKKPVAIHIGHAIVNYTPEGIKQFFDKIVSSRDPFIEGWQLGSVILNREAFQQLVEDFNGYNNEFAKVVLFLHDWRNSGRTCSIYAYKKKNSNAEGKIQINIIEEKQLNGRNQEHRRFD